MKNKNRIGKYLLLFIVVLIIATGFYAFANRERIFGSVEGEQVKDDEKSVQSVFDSGTNTRPTDRPIDVYRSPNERDVYGLKIISAYEEYEKILDNDFDNLIVFGREGCHFCEMYQPVLKEVANLYKIEIVYIDMASLSSEDYKKVIESALSIPAKCTKNREESDIGRGFGTPLSLFVRNKMTYDCIRGYKDKTDLIKDLKKIGYVY